MAVRIVIVDDHKILRDGLKMLLRQEQDFAVVGEASSAEEAYESVAKTDPNLLIIDISLPGESGIEATRRFRAEIPSAKILILTGTAQPNDSREVLMAGADGFISKDEAGTELVRAIRTVLAGKVYLSPEAATALMQSLKDGPERSAEPALNDREVAFLKGVADGKNYKEIAQDMKLSVKSVENYRARLVRKLGCSTRAELVRYAVRRGFVSA